MSEERSHAQEEAFGVLTDDGLYLDCLLIRPPGLEDAALTGLRVWVPKIPLTKLSVLACARKEVQAAGAAGTIGHLVFDLRGTGESDFKDTDYDKDLASIRAWAAERFPQADLRYYGTPTIGGGRVYSLPIRPAVLMEHYVFPAVGRPTTQSIVYLAPYGNFNPYDQVFCQELAQAGHHVYAMDPWRYLLHASLSERLTPKQLLRDFSVLLDSLPGAPVILSQPTAGGVGLLWAAGTPQVEGAIVIGRAQAGFRADHIFRNDNPHTFFAGRFASRLAPRPLALVMDGRSRREDADELAALYQASKPPRRLEKRTRLEPTFILELLDWVHRETP